MTEYKKWEMTKYIDFGLPDLVFKLRMWQCRLTFFLQNGTCDVIKKMLYQFGKKLCGKIFAQITSKTKFPWSWSSHLGAKVSTDRPKDKHTNRHTGTHYVYRLVWSTYNIIILKMTEHKNTFFLVKNTPIHITGLYFIMIKVWTGSLISDLDLFTAGKLWMCFRFYASLAHICFFDCSYIQF